jgi:hypothetical protein
MMRHTKLAGLIAALLAVFLSSFALAQSFGVSPKELRIDNLSPGEEAGFNITINNKDEAAHVFTLAAFRPREEERRAGRAEFPDASWVSFSSREIEVAAQSVAKVEVTVSIPSDTEWAGRDWEIWLGVALESSDLLTVELYVRLLVSTTPAGKGKPNKGLIAGIAVGIILLGCGAYYYFRRKARTE